MEPVAPLTVIIPAHKASATLGRTLEAVLFAKPRPAEVIVVLDGPDAKARRIAEGFRGVRVDALPENKGACAARNRGLDLAETPFVMFLDADDSVSPGLFWSLCASAQETGADLVFASHVIERADGQMEMRADPPPAGHAHLLRFWLSGRFVPPCSVLWRRDFLRRIGGWDESLAQNQDGDLVHRAIFNHAKLGWARAGYGIYIQGDPRTRVSKVMSPQAIASQFRVLERVEEMNRGNPLVSHREIGLAWYNLARRLYGRGQIEPADRALARARALGFREHAGNFVHRWLSRVLGLKGKASLRHRWLAGRRALN